MLVRLGGQRCCRLLEFLGRCRHEPSRARGGFFQGRIVLAKKSKKHQRKGSPTNKLGQFSITLVDAAVLSRASHVLLQYNMQVEPGEGELITVCVFLSAGGHSELRLEPCCR